MNALTASSSTGRNHFPGLKPVRPGQTGSNRFLSEPDERTDVAFWPGRSNIGLMRNLYGCVMLAGALVFVGCGKEESAPQSQSQPQPQAQAPAQNQTPAPGQPPPARDGYLGTLVRGQQTAVKGIDTAALNQEVQLFNVQEGRLPKDLNELVTKQYLGKLPEPPVGMKINYDPTTGKVTVVPQ